MKSISAILGIVLLAISLNACDDNSPQSNTLSVAEPTERENAILATTADRSFVFDFSIDSEYKEASVWIEKYEAGTLADDQINKLTAPVAKSGSIIFAASKTNDNQKQLLFNIGVTSNGSTGSAIGFDENSTVLDSMSSVWGSFQGEITPTEGEAVLASICYSDSDADMSSLTSEFYNNADGHLSELEKYDVVYLIKTEFVK